MLRPAKRKIRMVICVISNLVAFGHNSLHKRRIFFSVSSHEEEPSFDMGRLQNVEDLRRPFRIRPIIEGKRNLMRIARSLMIEGWELWELYIGSGQVAFLINFQLA